MKIWEQLVSLYVSVNLVKNLVDSKLILVKKCHSKKMALKVIWRQVI